KVALISHTILTARGLLKYICQTFSINCKSKNRAVLVATLEGYLTEIYRKGGQTLLIVDEAQNLKPEVLEQIYYFANFKRNYVSLFQILLVGQPELTKKLEHPKNEKLANCIQTRCQLTRLALTETKEYIEHRLQKAGFSQTEPLFQPEAIESIYEFTNGTPRLINILCDNALLMGFVLNSPQISAEIIKKVQFEDTFSEMELFNPPKIQLEKPQSMTESPIAENISVKLPPVDCTPSIHSIIPKSPRPSFLRKLTADIKAGFHWLEKWTSIPIEIFAVMGYLLLLLVLFLLLKMFYF
ncbi:AAA family ATPase, partial [candidate division KSB1 bacterium]|nr:AAA family ATPase [candidate division KSB1 bacterium]